jgi:hypothetical protein
MKDATTVSEKPVPKPLISPSTLFDRTLQKVSQKAPRFPIIIQFVFQTLAAIGLVFFITKLLKLIGVTGFTKFLDTAFSGLTLSAENFSFINGTYAILVLLLFVYFLFSVFLLPRSGVICDAATLLCLFFSVTMRHWAFESLIVPVWVIFVIWVVHRFLLGTLVYRYKKIERLSSRILSQEGVGDER